MLDCQSQIVTRSEFSQIVHFGFEDSPETLHRTVINTSADAGHTLTHIGGNEFGVKYLACVLKSSVAVKQRMSIRI